VQHDCHRGNCVVALTKRQRVERQITESRLGEVKHTDNTNYIINSAALSATSKHRVVADLPLEQVDGESQLRGLHEGLS
jgi:hypothetical protein